jgi:plastocyanin
VKKALILLVGMLAIAGATSPAVAQRSATATVLINFNGFNPEDVTVKPGDTVTWRNNDSAKHQVVADRGEFKSPVLDPGATWSYRVQVEGSFSYHDAEKPSLTATLNSVDLRPTASVTRRHVVYGGSVRVFGVVPNDASGERVTVRIQPYKGVETTRTVVTDDGMWEFSYRPTVRTDFEATWDGVTSLRTPTIAVRPRVVFRPLSLERNRFYVRVQPGAKYGRVLVRVQRTNSRGIWVTTLRVRLNTNGVKRFTGKFPRGATKARVWVRAKPGYVPGFSVEKRIVR